MICLYYLNTLETKFVDIERCESRLEATVTRIFQPPQGGTQNSKNLVSNVLNTLRQETKG